MMKSLQEVHMPQNGINHPGITALAGAFAVNPNLRVLNLSDNTFTEIGSYTMATVSKMTLMMIVIIICILIHSAGRNTIVEIIYDNLIHAGIGVSGQSGRGEL